jgi:hypothetical protein
MLFLASMLICGGSSLLGHQGVRKDLTGVGWHLPGDRPDHPSYSAPMAMSLSVSLSCVLGVTLTGIGLGLQAQRVASPWAAVGVTLFATLFWIVQTIFAIVVMRSVLLAIPGVLLTLLYAALLGLAMTSLREMLRDPPPPRLELLPVDYQIPYSHLHQDSPEVRLERDLEQRRRRVAVQQKEIDLLEEKLHGKTREDKT